MDGRTVEGESRGNDECGVSPGPGVAEPGRGLDVERGGRGDVGLWANLYMPTNQFIGRWWLLPWTIADRDEVEVAYLIDKDF